MSSSTSLIFRQRLVRFATNFTVLNKFIEINTFIKRNLNLKCEVRVIKFVERLIAT